MGQIQHIPSRLTSVDGIQPLPQEVVSFAHTYEDGYLSTWHNHPRHQLIYAVEGLMLTETRGARWVVPAGYGQLMPAGELHQVRMTGGVQIRSLFIRPEADPEFAARGVMEIQPLLAGLIEAFCAMENRDPQGARAHHLSRLILLELAAAPLAPLALPMPADPRLQKVCAALAARPGGRYGIDHWAAEAGMSRRSFTRAFQAELEMSFGQWQQRMRCQHGLRAMAGGGPPEAVARELGYASRYAMEAMMRRLFRPA